MATSGATTIDLASDPSKAIGHVSGPDWIAELARIAAQHAVEGEFRILPVGDSGSVYLGKAYKDRAVAFVQRTRVSNIVGRAYVVARYGDRVVVMHGPQARLVQIVDRATPRAERAAASTVGCAARRRRGGGGAARVDPSDARRKKIALADLGVAVHPKEEWPPIRARSSKRVPAPDGIVLHTTQKNVYEDHVLTKRGRILAGESPAVSVVCIDGRWWAFDGHHALAAYLMLGQKPVLALYNHDRGDQVAPPRLASR